MFHANTKEINSVVILQIMVYNIWKVNEIVDISELNYPSYCSLTLLTAVRLERK